MNVILIAVCFLFLEKIRINQWAYDSVTFVHKEVSGPICDDNCDVHAHVNKDVKFMVFILLFTFSFTICS